jgi:hypothetical protein
MARVIAENGEVVTLDDNGESTLVQKFLQQSGQRRFRTGDDVRKFLEEHKGKRAYSCDFSHLNPAVQQRLAQTVPVLSFVI